MGLLFAFMPVLATAAGGDGFDVSLLLTVMARVAGKLAVLGVAALVVARTVLPPATRWLARRFGADSFQLAAIAFCMLCALASARQGVSAELGAFVAGVMLSATEQQEAVLHHLGELAAARAGCTCACLPLLAGSSKQCWLPSFSLPAPRALLPPFLSFPHLALLPFLNLHPFHALPIPSLPQSRSPSSSWPSSSPPLAWC